MEITGKRSGMRSLTSAGVIHTKNQALCCTTCISDIVEVSLSMDGTAMECDGWGILKFSEETHQPTAALGKIHWFRFAMIRGEWFGHSTTYLCNNIGRSFWLHTSHTNISFCRHQAAVGAALRRDFGASLCANQVRFPAKTAPGFSYVGIVADVATGRRVFSDIFLFPPPLHSAVGPYSPCFTLIGSQDQCTRSLIGFATLWKRALRLIDYRTLRKDPDWLGCLLVSMLPGDEWRTAFRHFAGVCGWSLRHKLMFRLCIRSKLLMEADAAIGVGQPRSVLRDRGWHSFDCSHFEKPRRTGCYSKYEESATDSPGSPLALAVVVYVLDDGHLYGVGLGHVDRHLLLHVYGHVLDDGVGHHLDHVHGHVLVDGNLDRLVDGNLDALGHLHRHRVRLGDAHDERLRDLDWQRLGVGYANDLHLGRRVAVRAAAVDAVRVVSAVAAAAARTDAHPPADGVPLLQAANRHCHRRRQHQGHLRQTTNPSCYSGGATVAERLACSPPTNAIRVQSPAGSLRIFAPDDAVGQRVFSGISRFPTFNHPHRFSRPLRSRPGISDLANLRVTSVHISPACPRAHPQNFSSAPISCADAHLPRQFPSHDWASRVIAAEFSAPTLSPSA
ncbi:hypothetical protein PR048_031365 [Dryococelus australis]|uniref:Uncharacterized protein n=1 Tax=Dryococelus australis TaxID=614101 RepID=A0ABQ9G520_9NEOP|nr:hypothetical protein PR048_031365 [Dryococelus australis]